MRRTLAASAVPALVIAGAWLALEAPRRTGEAILVAALALAPALFPRLWQRVLALAPAAAVVVWIGLDAKVWDLRLLGGESSFTYARDRALDVGSIGIGDFYGVVLPFDPGGHVEMHALLLLAVFGFVAAVALFVASRRPVPAAALTVAGVGWPATLVDEGAVAVGALALAAALSIFLALRVRSAGTLAVGAVVSALVVAGAAWASSATTFAQQAALDWKQWDFRGLPAKALGVRFVWDANYDGISFPPTETVVLEIEGPERAQYWRASTLDLFTADRWFEQLDPTLIGDGDREIPLDALAPSAARDKSRWLDQRVLVKALVDDHVVAAGTPVALSARSLGTVFYLSGGVVRARRSLSPGTRYRVWSYTPDPSPSQLRDAPARYPRAATRYLEVWGAPFPSFGTAGREEVVSQLLSDLAFGPYQDYSPLYRIARRVAGDARSPYEAVLALESWFRRGGGFRYTEQPPRSFGVAPLVQFVTETKAGYCQHYAGAMALMLRLLGVPSRVAVGFTSGTRAGDTWRVTDHDAHAWVEVWFPGYGWVPFDPTPGRGTFSGIYSFASENAQAVEALGRGNLDAAAIQDSPFGREPSAGRTTIVTSSSRRPSLLTVVLVLCLVAGATIGTSKWLVRRARYLTSDPRRVASAARRELEGFLRDQRVPVPTSATLDDLGRAFVQEIGLDARGFVAAAAGGRFGPPDLSRASARDVRRELRTLVRAARRELSAWARLRGFVSLRSLRGEWQ